jgi:hypothetical protein
MFFCSARLHRPQEGVNRAMIEIIERQGQPIKVLPVGRSLNLTEESRKGFEGMYISRALIFRRSFASRFEGAGHLFLEVNDETFG